MIITHGSDFYIVCSKDYDKDLDIVSTRRNWNDYKEKCYKISIDR